MEPCPFCQVDRSREILAKNEYAFALFDKYPVSPGHTLVIPYRHEANYFLLSEQERKACWDLVQDVQAILAASFSPEGFNIGINVGEVAGQTVMHGHVHLIPRYLGDVENPKGGVRKAIPEKGDYTK